MTAVPVLTDAVDRTEEYFPSVNDWVPARRDGRRTAPLAATAGLDRCR